MYFFNHDIYTVVPPYPQEIFQDPQRMLETMSVPNPIYTVFCYTHMPMVKFNL